MRASARGLPRPRCARRPARRVAGSRARARAASIARLQIVFEGKSGFGRVFHRRGVEAEGLAARALDVPDGCPCLFHQLRRTDRIVRAETDADADRQMQRPAARGDDGLRERVEQRAREIGRGGRARQILAHDDELVAAQARKRIAGLELRLQPAGNRAHHGVSGLQAQHFVDSMESVDIERGDRHAAAGAHRRAPARARGASRAAAGSPGPSARPCGRGGRAGPRSA